MSNSSIEIEINGQIVELRKKYNVTDKQEENATKNKKHKKEQEEPQNEKQDQKQRSSLRNSFRESFRNTPFRSSSVRRTQSCYDPQQGTMN